MTSKSLQNKMFKNARICAFGVMASSALMTAGFAIADDMAASETKASQDLSHETLEAYIQKTIEAFNITGMAVAVVSADAVIFQNTYGLRDINGTAKVNADTIFPFGSVGKAFTTAALATLVDEGKIDWDDKVRQYIPEFEMSDPYITEEFTIKDLLTHRSGLPLGAGDLLIFPDGYLEMQDVLNVFKTIKPTSSFRSEYAYDNLMYIVAGEVLARAHGGTWSDALETRLFDPLEMTSCKALPSEAMKSKNTALEHERNLGGKTAAPLNPLYILPDGSAPAGGISCSISDMAKWAQFWLREGKSASGETLILDAQVKKLWTGVTPTPVNRDAQTHAKTNFSLYALGWAVSDFHGEQFVYHSGGLLGAVSYIGILPEKDIAVVFMANDWLPYVSGFVKQILQDVSAPEAGFDWIAEAEEKYNNYLELSRKDAGLDEAQLVDISVPPVRPLSEYVGTYTDPWYGDVTLSLREGQLHIDTARSKAFDVSLVSVDTDKFVARWTDRALNADAYLNFQVEDETVVGLRMEAVSETTDFSYDFHDLRFVKN